MQKIRNVVFDAGSILIDFRWDEILREHGFSEEKLQRAGQEAFESPYWQIIDYGTDDVAWLADRLSQVYPEDADAITCLLAHADEMAVRRPEVEKRIPLLKAAGYRIYILSNYSGELFDMHVRCLPFIPEIDGILLSSEEKMLKPQARIYRRFLEKFGLRGEECLFFDDREENVRASVSAGLPALHTPTQEMLLAELEKLLKETPSENA